MIRAASGFSKSKDSFTAGKEAVAQSTEKLSAQPDIIWLFSGISQDHAQVLAGVASVVGNVPLIGCTTDGEISPAGLTSDSVVVLSLVSDSIVFHTATEHSLSTDPYASGLALGKQFRGKNCSYLQIFSDGLTGNAVKIIEGIQVALGPHVRIAGGASGDGGQFRRTYQFHGSNVQTDSIVAVGFAGEFTLGTGAGCGWFPVGTAKKVTRSVGNEVFELDGLPALQVYEKFLGRHAAQLPAVGVEYPLGLLNNDENADSDFFLCRATMGVNHERKSIIFAGDIPQGAYVKMTMGNELDVIDAARKAAHGALSDLQQKSSKQRPEVVFIYSCMARKIVLGSKTGEELGVIQDVLGADVPVIGFYTYGEYAPANGSRLSCFQNETVTLSILCE